jgi:hypothetical protein
MFVTHDWLAGPIPKLKPTYAAVSENYIAKEKRNRRPNPADSKGKALFNLTKEKGMEGIIARRKDSI